MATSLAAAIKSAFAIKSTLVAGNNGIFEVSVEDKMVYTNQSRCQQGFPTTEQMVEAIGQFIGMTPKSGPHSISQSDGDQGPACSLLNHDEENPATGSYPISNQVDTRTGCGCRPTKSSSEENVKCCS